jgi:hypothetical protein
MTENELTFDDLTDEHVEVLLSLYSGTHRAADPLAYSDEMAKFVSDFQSRTRLPVVSRDMHRILVSARKRGLLRRFKKERHPIKGPSTQIQWIIVRLYDAQPVVVDDLPYTPEFDWILAQLNARTGRRFSEKDLWLFFLYLRKKKEGNPPPRLPLKGRKKPAFVNGKHKTFPGQQTYFL